jgi:hypothetical protein
MIKFQSTTLNYFARGGRCRLMMRLPSEEGSCPQPFCYHPQCAAQVPARLKHPRTPIGAAKRID